MQYDAHVSLVLTENVYPDGMTLVNDVPYVDDNYDLQFKVFVDEAN